MVQRLVECVHCKNADCGRQTALLPEMLEGTFEYRIGLLKDAPPIAISCMQCKHVYNYQGHDWVGSLILEADNPYSHSEHPASLVAFVKYVGCGEKGCDSRLQVIAVRASGTSDADVRAELSTWVWHDLSCPHGHQIPKIPNVQ